VQPLTASAAVCVNIPFVRMPPLSYDSFARA
jgi:hypothetical protein